MSRTDKQLTTRFSSSPPYSDSSDCGTLLWHIMITSQGMEILALNHVGVGCTKREEMEAFYIGTLGDTSNLAGSHQCVRQEMPLRTCFCFSLPHLRQLS